MQETLASQDMSSLWLSRVGRILLAILFIAGAVQKVMDPTPSMAMLNDIGMPNGTVGLVAFFNLVAGVMLIIGAYLRPLALILAVYCIATSYFHFIPADGWQMSIFVKNWAIAGGFLCLAAHSQPKG